jgi:hypothetical protein
MRTLLLLAALFHATWFGFISFTWTINHLVAAAIGIIVTIAVGLTLLLREDHLPRVIVGNMAGLIALSGWGGWLATQLLDDGPVVHLYALYLPLASAVVFVVAAFLSPTPVNRSPGA